jgi:uncharacterized LabA/DUF88 family protein
MDMIPAMKLARREGVQVVVTQFPSRGISRELIEDADSAGNTWTRRLDFQKLRRRGFQHQRTWAKKGEFRRICYAELLCF